VLSKSKSREVIKLNLGEKFNFKRAIRKQKGTLIEVRES
jgi:hypothetical protein